MFNVARAAKHASTWLEKSRAHGVRRIVKGTPT